MAKVSKKLAAAIEARAAATAENDKYRYNDDSAPAKAAREAQYQAEQAVIALRATGVRSVGTRAGNGGTQHMLSNGKSWTEY